MAWLFPRNPPLLLLIMHQHTHAAGTKLGVHFQRGRGKRRYGGEKVRVEKNWRVRWKKNIEGALTALFTHAIAWRVTQASIIGVGQAKNQTLANYCQQNGLQGAWLVKMWKHIYALSFFVCIYGEIRKSLWAALRSDQYQYTYLCSFLGEQIPHIHVFPTLHFSQLCNFPFFSFSQFLQIFSTFFWLCNFST